MTSDLRRSTLSSHFQTIQSHYYNITDSESWPVAGLLVLLDSNERPVRGELHLYEDLPSHIQEAAVRQSRLVLQERYFGQEMVPLRILHTTQMREAMDVRLSSRKIEAERSERPVWQGIVVAGALVALALVMWGALALLRPGSSEQPDPRAGVEQAAATSSTTVENGGETSESGPAAAVSGASGGSASTAVGQGELPPSRHARADMGIGMRVKILPGFSLTLRSEAGAQAGVPMGYLVNEQEALIVGGPLLAQGDADTIVWWLVELADGTQAWAAANTSQTTLLVPAD